MTLEEHQMKIVNELQNLFIMAFERGKRGDSLFIENGDKCEYITAAIHLVTELGVQATITLLANNIGKVIKG